MVPAIKKEVEHETKFVISNFEAHKIIQWLHCRCVADPDYPSGLVSSIYFDTHDWRFLREKINSDFFKTKVRLRWYSHPDNGVPYKDSFLEIKYKVGSGRSKLREITPFSREWLSSTRLESSDFFQINQLIRSKRMDFLEPVFPVFQISYKRYRWIEPTTGARLCCDHDIHVPRINSQRLPRMNPFNLSRAVFELKGLERELPPVLHQLTALGCRKESFSKYRICYQKLTETAFNY